MKLETKIVKTKDYRKTIFGKVSIVLFILSTIIIFINSSGFFEKDLLAKYFGSYNKSIALVSLLIYFNGFFVLFSKSFYRSIGILIFNEQKIIALDRNKEMSLELSEIDRIELEYFGHKKKWNNWFPGPINILKFHIKKDQKYRFQFILDSKASKLDLIKFLLNAHELGIDLNLEYKVDYGSYVGDKDFKVLRLGLK